MTNIKSCLEIGTAFFNMEINFYLCWIMSGDRCPPTPPAKGCFTLWKPNFHIFPSLKGEENMRTAQ